MGELSFGRIAPVRFKEGGRFGRYLSADDGPELYVALILASISWLASLETAGPFSAEESSLVREPMFVVCVPACLPAAR
jgi:hypothetical protein